MTVTDANDCSSSSSVMMDNVVSIESLSEEVYFEISPNSGQSEVKTHFKLSIPKPWQLSIVNNLGQTIKEYSNNHQKLEHTILLNDLPVGHYSVVLSIGKQRLIRKLVITH